MGTAPTAPKFPMQPTHSTHAFASTLSATAPPLAGEGTQRQILTLPDVQRLLAGKDERSRLATLAHGDPLNMYESARRWLRRACLLYEVEPFVKRACVALCSQQAVFDKQTSFCDEAGQSRIPLECWLDPIHRRTADVLHAQDQRAEQEGQALPEPLPARFHCLQAVLGIEDCNLRVACIHANALPDRERSAFFHLIIRGMGLADYSRSHGMNAETARQALADALKTIGHGQDLCAPYSPTPMEQA